MSDKATKLLLIEDNAGDRLLFQKTLGWAEGGSQFDLEWADRLSTGLARLAAGGIEVILLDMGLPDSQGLDTLRRVLAAAPDAQVLLMKGLDDERLAMQAVQAGAQDYLVKGQLDGTLLVRAINYAIERRRMLAKLEVQSRELQAAETRLRTIIENVADSIIMVDGNGLMRFVNPTAETLFGRKAEELRGEMFGFPLMAEEATELDIVRPDGSTVIAEMRVVETTWEGEAATLASLRDITERVRAEEAVRESERFLAWLNNITRTALESADLATMLRILAAHVRELFGADTCYLTQWDETRQTTVPGAVSGMGDKALHSDQLEPIEVTMSQWVLRAGRTLVVEDVHNSEYVSSRFPEMAPEGSILGLPLITDGEKLGAMLVVFDHLHHFLPDDIARGEQAAGQIALALARAHLVTGLSAEVEARTAEIRDEQEKSETILRSVGDAIMMTDLGMQVQYVNEAFTHLTGYAAQEVLGKFLGSMIFGTGSGQAAWQAIEAVLSPMSAWQGETVCRRKDGRTYDAALIVNPLRAVDGATLGYVFSHRDISRQRELDRARGRFMVNVSHELRTPLNTLQLSLRLLTKLPQSEKANQLLQRMTGQTERLSQLVEDVVLLAGLDSGQTAMSLKMVSTSSIVLNVVRVFQGRAEQKELGLVVKPAPADLPLVRGDVTWLNRALGELVENAILYTPAGGRVILETGVGELDGVRMGAITVRDTGPGLTSAHLGQVFDHFSRGSQADSGHIPGTGLGLSMVQEIMRAHGGRVTVESKLGEGSAFTLWMLTEAGPATVLPVDASRAIDFV